MDSKKIKNKTCIGSKSTELQMLTDQLNDAQRMAGTIDLFMVQHFIGVAILAIENSIETGERRVH